MANFVMSADKADQLELTRRAMQSEGRRREAARLATLRTATADRTPKGAKVMAVAQGGGLIVRYD